MIKKKLSVSVLNSYNLSTLRSVLCFKPKYIHFVYSFVAYVAFSCCLRREDQFVVFFSHEEHENMHIRCHGK